MFGCVAVCVRIVYIMREEDRDNYRGEEKARKQNKNVDAKRACVYESVRWMSPTMVITISMPQK